MKNQEYSMNVIILWKAFFHSLPNDNIFNSLFFITHLYSAFYAIFENIIGLAVRIILVC